MLEEFTILEDKVKDMLNHLLALKKSNEHLKDMLEESEKDRYSLIEQVEFLMQENNNMRKKVMEIEQDSRIRGLINTIDGVFARVEMQKIKIEGYSIENIHKTEILGHHNVAVENADLQYEDISQAEDETQLSEDIVPTNSSTDIATDTRGSKSSVKSQSVKEDINPLSPKPSSSDLTESDIPTEYDYGIPPPSKKIPPTAKAAKNKSEKKSDRLQNQVVESKTAPSEIKSASKEDILVVADTEDPFSSASDTDWDSEVEKNSKKPENPSVVNKEYNFEDEDDDDDDEYIFGDGEQDSDDGFLLEETLKASDE